MLKMSALHIVVILTLVPALALAGGKHETTHSGSPPRGSIGNTSSYTSPPVPVTPPNAPQSPTSPAGGNNGQIYCSSPTAPGWRVSLPNGGCTTSIPLKVLPYTGYDPTPWEYIVDLLSAVWHMIYL